MNCSERQIDISTWLDGSLDPQREECLKNHLEECPVCLDFYREQQHLNRLLTENFPDQAPPEYVWHRISASIAAETAPARRSRWNDFRSYFESAQLAYGFAALLLFGLASLFALKVYDGFSAHPEYLAELDSFTIEKQGNPFLNEVVSDNPFWIKMAAAYEVPNKMKNPFERYEEVKR